MNAAAQLATPTLEARLITLEAEVKSLAQTALQQSTRLDSTAELMKGSGQEEKLSLIVFSGSLDRLIAAFVLATGAAAMGMKVSMFFTFWGTAALRRDNVRVKKTLPRAHVRLDAAERREEAAAFADEHGGRRPRDDPLHHEEERRGLGRGDDRDLQRARASSSTSAR